MSDAYAHLDDATLDDLLAQHRTNLCYLEIQAAKYSTHLPLDLHNQLQDERRNHALLLAEQQRRATHPPPSSPAPVASPTPIATPAPAPPAARTRGSPFVVGRPLRAEEPIFGRDDALRFAVGCLEKGSSLNLVGERRIGKTSLINHLLATPAISSHATLLPIRIDLQRGITSANRFYGTTLRDLFADLPANAPAELAHLRKQLQERPETDDHTLDRWLTWLNRHTAKRPLLIIDEFERLLEPSLTTAFPYPLFFDGLRALITANLVAMLVASCRPLANHFTDPQRANSLTSTFPTYFVPLTLTTLDAAAADRLLLQPSDHTLTLAEAADARRWAHDHPCHLQVAGAALYQAKTEGRPTPWINQRRDELKQQNCMTSASAPRHQPRIASLRTLGIALIRLPLTIGRAIQHLGNTFSTLAAWLIGAALIIVVILAIGGIANGTDLLAFLYHALGISAN